MRLKPAGVVLLAVAAGAAAPSDAAAPRARPFRWYRSAVVHRGHVVRIAVESGSDDKIVRRADVRQGSHTVHIGLLERVYPGNHTAIGYLYCVQVRLRFAVAERKIVDSVTGRAPDFAGRNTHDGRLRDDTWSIDLAKGPCVRLRPRYLPRER